MISFFANLMPHHYHLKLNNLPVVVFVLSHLSVVCIMTEDIEIRSDLASCSQIPAIKLQVSLPHPLASLIMEVPSLDELPVYDSHAKAGVKLLKEIRKELLQSPAVREVNQLVEKARPLASDMRLLKPCLMKEFNQYVPFKLPFTLTVVVFVVSTLLHLFFMFVDHKFHRSERLVQMRSKMITAK